MAKAEDVRIAPPPDALPAEHVWQILVPQGPRRLPQWAGCHAFVTDLTAFWQGLPYRARRRGELGTAWAELWIACEMQYGRCPRAPPALAQNPYLLWPTFYQGLRAPALDFGHHYFGH